MRHGSTSATGSATVKRSRSRSSCSTFACVEPVQRRHDAGLVEVGHVASPPAAIVGRRAAGGHRVRPDSSRNGCRARPDRRRSPACRNRAAIERRRRRALAPRRAARRGCSAGSADHRPVAGRGVDWRSGRAIDREVGAMTERFPDRAGAGDGADQRAARRPSTGATRCWMRRTGSTGCYLTAADSRLLRGEPASSGRRDALARPTPRRARARGRRLLGVVLPIVAAAGRRPPTSGGS